MTEPRCKTLAELLRRNAYVRIVLAAREGRGVRLTPEETWIAANDAAIVTAAQLDAERAGWILENPPRKLTP